MTSSSRPGTRRPALVRVVICGAVDDGKSTLLGRLLFETASISSDELEAARRSSLSSNALMDAEKLDFSLLVDGLESEREQGITIDIAHRQLRLGSGTRILLADSPGHEQYTRNMSVASSTADIAILVVDAVRGIRKQTLRHAAVCRLMGVRQLIVAINKLDATPDPTASMSAIRESLLESFAQAQWATNEINATGQFSFIGVSGLRGDNVTTMSARLPAGSQPTLLAALEAACDAVSQPRDRRGSLRLPVQAVLRNDTHRRYAGRLLGDELSVGDTLAVWPSGSRARVIALYAPDECKTAAIGRSVSVELDTELDIGRGDILVRAEDAAELPESRAHLAEMVWMHTEPLDASTSYLLKCGPLEVPARVESVRFVLDLDTGEQLPGRPLEVNTIGRVEISCDRPILLDAYADHRDTGGFLLVDRRTGATVAAGMAIHPVRRESEVVRHSFTVDRAAREQLNGFRAGVLWLTGLPGSGKSTIADELEKRLFDRGVRSFVLDGDTVRQTLSEDLGFSPEDRAENVRRVARTAQLMVDAGLIVIVSLVSPFRADRELAKEMFADSDFYEVFVDTTLELCMERDPKGLYARAATSGGGQMTGTGQAYEQPLSPDIRLDGASPVDESVARLLGVINDRRLT